MQTRRISRAVALVSMAIVVESIAGCGVFDGYQREHHFKDEGSTALLLDAKQRVLTQRKVKPDREFQGRVQTEIVVCAEPSPDVANALSSALSTSLNAALPSAAGSKNLSADLSFSKAESIVQLGSRIATIQLLRDELADLCRSYANGAVSTTTYTLRLSRLDKKMVTLLLSEAAGRPAGTQSVILGDAAAGTKPAATAEEISKARQAVIDASDALVTKEKELKDTTEEEAKTTKQGERDDALKALQDKQVLLLAMERRVLDTSTGADVQTVVLNSTPTGPNPGETLVALQDNFLLQDDLTTFLDACISSLDLLQRPIGDLDKAQLSEQWALVQSTEADAEKARRAAADAKIRFLERTQGQPDRMQGFDPELAQAENASAQSEGAAERARDSYRDFAARFRQISRFGEFCQDGGLRMIVDANVNRIAARRGLLEARRQLVAAESHDTALRVCEIALKSGDASDEVKKSCATALAQRPQLLEASTDAAPDDLALRTAERRPR